MNAVNRQPTILTLGDPRYPRRLAAIPKPPQRLYLRGDVGVLARTTIAIVGTRRPTDEGVAFTQLIVEALNRFSEVVTISGLAFGIDAAVHRSAVNAGRPTVAVLASGVDTPTPTSHVRLAEDLLAAGGCLVSEFPPSTPARKQHFPQRNRVIAGLSKATLVVEAGEPSGALITAYQALELNRDVLAVPGSPFNAAAAGTNSLIKRGAVPITHPDDVLDALGIAPTTAAVTPVTGDAARVLEQLATPRDVDQLMEACTIPLARLTSVLSILELEGRIRILPDSRVVRTSNEPTVSHRRVTNQSENARPLPRQGLSD